MDIDRARAKAIHEAAQAALKKVAEQFDVKLTKSGCTYDTDNVSLRVSLDVVGESGRPNKEAETFKRDCTMYGLEPEHLGATFKHGARTYTITGINPRAKKYPIVVTCGGKGYKFPSDIVRRELGIDDDGNYYL